MAVSRFATENDLGRAMTHLAQRWAGSSTPVNMMHVGDLRLLLPLGGSAPQSAHMFYELRSLGYSLAVGWRCEPLACGDATIYDALLDAAGGDDAFMTDEELASFQIWRRAAKVMWVSELLRADGRTLRTRFDRDLQRRVRNCEEEALRLCMVAFGHGRTRPAIGDGAWASPSLRYGRCLRLANCSGALTLCVRSRNWTLIRRASVSLAWWSATTLRQRQYTRSQATTRSAQCDLELALVHPTESRCVY